MNSIQDIPILFQAAIATAFGLIIGSFLNVVIYRIPRGESVAYPASHCGSCGAAVRPYDNIPILSWLILRGKCRSCGSRISWVYPVVELLTGISFFYAVCNFGFTASGAVACFFLSVLISLVFIDYRHQLLPNVITYPAFAVVMIFSALGWLGEFLQVPGANSRPLEMSRLLTGAALLLAAAGAFYVIDLVDGLLFNKYLELLEDDDDQSLDGVDNDLLIRQHDLVIRATIIGSVLFAVAWIVWAGYLYSRPGGSMVSMAPFDCLIASAFGAATGAGIIWLLRAVYFYTRGFGGMGLGDVKMMAIVGAFLGWQNAILVLILGSVAGSIIGIAQIALGRSSKGLKTKLPFGIFLGLGSVVALFYGNEIIRWYLGLMR